MLESKTDVNDGCFRGEGRVSRRQMSGHVHDVNWRAWLMDDSHGFHMP